MTILITTIAGVIRFLKINYKKHLYEYSWQIDVPSARILLAKLVEIPLCFIFLTFKEAKWAKDNEVFLEITTRGGHSLGNGLVAELGMKTDAKLILNTDSHAPRDYITPDLREKTALGSGIPRSMFEPVFCTGTV